MALLIGVHLIVDAPVAIALQETDATVVITFWC
jgi:hypothetical protein